MLNKIQLTNHAVDRIFERFPKLISEKKLSRYDVDLKKQKELPIWTEIIRPMLEGATENRTFLNNTKMLIGFYERYGFDKQFKFFDNVKERARFVLCEKEDCWTLVTVIELEFEKIRQNVKYNNPQNTLGSKNQKKDVEVYQSTLEVEQEPVVDVVEPEAPEAPVERNYVLIWENQGRIRDENGYFVTDVEQIENAGISLRSKIGNIRKKAVIKAKPEVMTEVQMSEDGYFHFTKEVYGYKIDFKMFNSMAHGFEFKRIYDVV